MLPLLHEPVRRALDALAVGRRRRHWHHAAAFLGVLREVGRAAAEEGHAMAAAAAAALQAVRPLRDLLDEMESHRVRPARYCSCSTRHSVSQTLEMSVHARCVG